MDWVVYAVCVILIVVGVVLMVGPSVIRPTNHPRPIVPPPVRFEHHLFVYDDDDDSDEVGKLDGVIVNVEAAVLNVQLAERAVLEFHRRLDPQCLSRQGLQKLFEVIVETYADSMAELGRLKVGLNHSAGGRSTSDKTGS